MISLEGNYFLWTRENKQQQQQQKVGGMNMRDRTERDNEIMNKHVDCGSNRKIGSQACVFVRRRSCENLPPPHLVRS